MRTKNLGAIGAVWGGLIIANNLLSERADGNTAYESGHTLGIVLGLIILVAGLYYFFKKPNQ